MFIQHLLKEKQRLEETLTLIERMLKESPSSDAEKNSKSYLPELNEASIDKAITSAKSDISIKFALIHHPDHTVKTLKYLLSKITSRKNQDLLNVIFTHPKRTKKLVSEGIEKISDFLYVKIALMNNELTKSDLSKLISIWKNDIAKPLRKRQGWLDGSGYGYLDYLFLMQKNYDDLSLGSLDLLQSKISSRYLIAFSRNNLAEGLFNPYLLANELSSILSMYKSPSCTQEFKDTIEQFVELIKDEKFSPFIDKYLID